MVLCFGCVLVVICWYFRGMLMVCGQCLYGVSIIFLMCFGWVSVISWWYFDIIFGCVLVAF